MVACQHLITRINYLGNMKVHGKRISKVILQREMRKDKIMASYHLYSEEELNARVALSEIQMREGKTYTHVDVMQTLHDRIVQTTLRIWLCKI